MRQATRPPIQLALALAAAALLGGCAAVGELARSAFQEPKLHFKDVAIEALDFDGATVALDYRLVNPNGFGLELAKVTYGLSLERREVTHGEIEGGLAIPANGEAPIRVTARLPFAEVPRLLELVQRGGTVPYAVRGSVGVRTPLGLLDLPVEHSGQVPLPGLPAFRLGGVDIRLAGLTDVEVEVHVAVHNPNPFPLPAGHLRYALTVDGQPVASAEAQELRPVAPRSEGRLTIPVRISLLGAGRAVAGALRGGGAEVKVTGQARLGALPVPLDIRGQSGD